MGGLFFPKNASHEGTKLFRKTCGRFVLHAGTNDQIMPEEKGSITNTFSSNLNTVNLKIFPNHGGIFA